MGLRLTAASILLLLGIGGALAPAAIAADQVVLKYRILERSIAVDDLTEFAETGELTRPLRQYIRVSGEESERVRQTLTHEFEVSPRLLDRVLNSPVGDVVLEQVSEAVYTPSRSADEAALRSALVLAASDDSRVSLLEVVQHYPTPQVYVDGERLGETYNRLSTLSTRLGSLLEDIGL